MIDENALDSMLPSGGRSALGHRFTMSDGAI